MATTGQQTFDLSCDLINKRLPTGQINTATTASYKARCLGLLNSWQEELAISLNVAVPSLMTDLSQNLTLNYPSCAAYFLATNFLLIEDPDSAGFFNDKFEEFKRMLMKKQPIAPATITDVYNLAYDQNGGV